MWGSIQIEDPSAKELFISSFSGDVRVVGSQYLGEYLEPTLYTIETVTGGISINTQLRGRLRAKTTSGEIYVSLEGEKADYFLKTATGDITVNYNGESWSPDKSKEYRIFGNTKVYTEIKMKKERRLFTTELLGAIEYQIEPLDYNRVDGLLFGYSNTWHLRNDSASVSISYATGRGNFEGKAVLHKNIYSPINLSFVVSIFSITSSYDRWMWSDWENILATVIFKEDERDYFLSEGLSAGFSLYPTSRLRFYIGYERAHLKTLNTQNVWGVLSKREFRDNPQIEEGHLSELTLSIGYQLSFIEAVLLYENSRIFNDDYDMERIFAVTRTHLSELRIRTAFGYSRHKLFYPVKFYRGGISTLPGYEYKESPGDWMLLINSEYRIEDYELLDILFFSDLGLIEGRDNVMFDIGTGLSPLSFFSIRVAYRPNNNEFKFFLRLDKTM